MIVMRINFHMKFPSSAMNEKPSSNCRKTFKIKCSAIYEKSVGRCECKTVIQMRGEFSDEQTSTVQ